MVETWIGRAISLPFADFFDSIDFYEKCKLENENLYRGYIDPSIISAESGFNIYYALKNCIENNEFDGLDKTNDINDIVIYYKNLYFLGKICFLTEQYLQAQKFKHPLCAHYNPRSNTHVVHPGLGRIEVCRLLNLSKIYSFYFNTTGKPLSKIGILNERNLEKVDLRNLLENEPLKFAVRFTFDHGTIIPQVMYKDEDREIMYQYIKEFKNKIDQLKFRINYNIDFFKNFICDDASININLSTCFSKLDIARAFVFSIIGHNYKSENITVEVNN